VELKRGLTHPETHLLLRTVPDVTITHMLSCSGQLWLFLPAGGSHGCAGLLHHLYAGLPAGLFLLHRLLRPHVRGRSRFRLKHVQLRESNCTINLKKQQALQPLIGKDQNSPTARTYKTRRMKSSGVRRGLTRPETHLLLRTVPDVTINHVLCCSGQLHPELTTTAQHVKRAEATAVRASCITFTPASPPASCFCTASCAHT